VKKGFKYITDALRMTHRLDKGMLPTTAAASLLKSVTPLIAALLTAFILDRLALNAPYPEIMPTVLGGVVLVFLANVAASRFDKYRSARTMAVYYKWENLNGEKSMSLDYPQLEDPAISQLRDRMRSDRNWGFGIGNTFSLSAPL